MAVQRFFCGNHERRKSYDMTFNIQTYVVCSLVAFTYLTIAQIDPPL